MNFYFWLGVWQAGCSSSSSSSSSSWIDEIRIKKKKKWMKIKWWSSLFSLSVIVWIFFCRFTNKRKFFLFIFRLVCFSSGRSNSTTQTIKKQQQKKWQRKKSYENRIFKQQKKSQKKWLMMMIITVKKIEKSWLFFTCFSPYFFFE